MAIDARGCGARRWPDRRRQRPGSAAAGRKERLGERRTGAAQVLPREDSGTRSATRRPNRRPPAPLVSGPDSSPKPPARASPASGRRRRTCRAARHSRAGGGSGSPPNSRSPACSERWPASNGPEGSAWPLSMVSTRGCPPVTATITAVSSAATATLMSSLRVCTRDMAGFCHGGGGVSAIAGESPVRRPSGAFWSAWLAPSSTAPAAIVMIVPPMKAPASQEPGGGGAGKPGEDFSLGTPAVLSGS